MAKAWLRKCLKMIAALLASLMIAVPIYVYRFGPDHVVRWSLVVAAPFFALATFEFLRDAGRLKGFFARRSFNGMLFAALICTLPSFLGNIIGLILSPEYVVGLQYGMYVGLLTRTRYATLDRPDSPNLGYWKVNSAIFGLLFWAIVFWGRGHSRAALIEAFVTALSYCAGLWLGLLLGNHVNLWIEALKPTFEILRRMGRPLVAFAVGYLTIIVLFATFYAALLRVDAPGSFAGVPSEPGFAVPLYFSLVTATTVGYGDIAPRSVLARSLTGVEVLTAIAWTLVVFAVLVIQLSKSEGKDT